MIVKTFPDWAPPKLVEYYQGAYNLPNIGMHLEKERGYLMAIISHPEMRDVWKMLYIKWTRYGCPANKTPSFENGAMALSLFSAIKGAIGETERKKTTRRYDKFKYLDIAMDARALASRIKQSSLNKSPLHWFPDHAINSILKNDIKTEKAEGYFCLAYDENEFHKKGGVYTRRITKDANGNDVWEYLKIDKNTKEFFKNQCITPRYPLLAEILKNIADEADAIAEHEATKLRIVSNSSASEATIFVRALYPFWIKYYGGPLYGTFATLCRVILDDSSIGADTIKDALKGYKITS